ncbi:DUF2535 family protein [Litchfieldia alkalitelluris]|uniref:DUF2535 family protein n=1 Tax=Litchfieldia alkalitelluris TaxID=304268 RepID=UPI000997F6DE|nr:DUF2535 family protein [Litchfieldia alkalitelluris]
MLYKSLEFKNAAGQKVKIIEIPVVGNTNHYYFMIQARLQHFISKLYNRPQEKTCYSFREYMKLKMNWTDFNNLFSMEELRNNS